MLVGQWQEVADYSECNADNPNSFDPTDKWVSIFPNSSCCCCCRAKDFWHQQQQQLLLRSSCEQFNLAYNCLISISNRAELDLAGRPIWAANQARPISRDFIF